MYKWNVLSSVAERLTHSRDTDVKMSTSPRILLHVHAQWSMKSGRPSLEEISKSNLAIHGSRFMKRESTGISADHNISVSLYIP